MGSYCCRSSASAENELINGLARNCSTQVINGVCYDSNDIVKIVHLQRAVRAFKRKRKSVEDYVGLVPQDVPEEDIFKVKVSFRIRSNKHAIL